MPAKAKGGFTIYRNCGKVTDFASESEAFLYERYLISELVMLYEN
jgi:hypothetical protein